MVEDLDFVLEIERIKMNYDFSKTGLMLLLVLFSVGGVMTRYLGNSRLVIPVIVIGLLTCVAGLILIPKLYNNELDRLKRRGELSLMPLGSEEETKEK